MAIFALIILFASVGVVLLTDILKIDNGDMKMLVLAEEQKQMVLDRLDDVQGSFDEYIEVGSGITIHAWGILDIEGYRENDYHNGTGAFVETGRIADVSLDATIEDEFGNVEDYELSDEFCKKCWDYLQRVKQ